MAEPISVQVCPSAETKLVIVSPGALQFEPGVGLPGPHASSVEAVLEIDPVFGRDRQQRVRPIPPSVRLLDHHPALGPLVGRLVELVTRATISPSPVSV